MAEGRSLSLKEVRAIVGLVAGPVVRAMVAVALVRRIVHSEKVELHCQKTRRNLAIVDRARALARFAPTPYLPGPHFQTLFSARFRVVPGLPFSRVLFPVSLGGQVGLDVLDRTGKLVGYLQEAAEGKTPDPVVPFSHGTLLLLHGLTGGSHEPYIQHTAEEAWRRGFSVVVLNARGCGGLELKSPHTFSAAFTADVRQVAHTLASAYLPRLHAPAHASALCPPLFAAGFSLGAVILTKFLCEEGGAAVLRAGVACCASFDLEISSKRIVSGLNAFTYDQVLTKSLLRFFERHAGSLGGATWVDVRRIRACRSLRDFDASVVVPQFGYDDVDHYYRDASSGGELAGRIGVPFLAINAKDDPITDAHGVPLDAPAQNPNIFLALTQEGGHVAWCSGWTPWKGASWGEKAAIDFIAAVWAQE